MPVNRRVLLIKLSSMGDVLHTLYAVDEASRKMPDIIFDWVIEPDYIPLIRSLPNVRAIPYPNRELRKKSFSFFRLKALRRRIRRQLNRNYYYAAIDAQGLIKSASILRLLPKNVRKHGFDKANAREPLASLFYTHHHALPVTLHATLRSRLLFAKALGYKSDTSAAVPMAPLRRLRSNAAKPNNWPENIWFLAHASAWTSKLYPLAHWAQLAQLISQNGGTPVMTYRGEHEHERAKTIAWPSKALLVNAPDLATLVHLLSHARFAIGSDTGLLHLSAALGVPSIGLFGATSIKRSGSPFGNLSNHHICSPCFKRVCPLDAALPPCMQALSPVALFEKSQALLQNITSSLPNHHESP